MKDITIYDSKNYCDRYTIFIEDAVFGMSENPLSPMGFNQFRGDTSEIKKDSRWGVKIEYKNLNDDVKKAIQDRIKTNGGK
tara:strand:+ start:794 stop:1036 length:243 start_codon:yes stop_codon:yes gene_type:complete